MAETTTQGTGAVASVTGFLKGLINDATPVVNSYLQYRAGRETAPSTMPANTMPGTASAGSAASDWRGTTATPSGASIMSAPWFPFAVGGVILAVLGFGFLAIRRK